jgi:hypothetical protein
MIHRPTRNEPPFAANESSAARLGPSAGQARARMQRRASSAGPSADPAPKASVGDAPRSRAHVVSRKLQLRSRSRSRLADNGLLIANWYRHIDMRPTYGDLRNEPWRGTRAMTTSTRGRADLEGILARREVNRAGHARRRHAPRATDSIASARRRTACTCEDEPLRTGLCTKKEAVCSDERHHRDRG